MGTRSTDLAEPVEGIGHDKNGMPFLVRPFRPTDREALERFYEEFEPKQHAQGLPPAHPARRRCWLESILADGQHFLATHGGELIGHAFIVPTAEAGIGEYAVFLREEARGRGIGTAVNRIAAEAARRSGWGGLWLTVEPRNRRAVGSYENAGFRFIPTTVFSLEAEMRLDLGAA